MVICVTKNLVDNSYIDDYWKNNLIIDNIKTFNINLTEEENQEFYNNLDNYNSNNNNNYNSNKNNNHTNSNYNTNSNNYYLKTTYNNKSQNEGYYKKPYENKYFYKNTNNEYSIPIEPRYKEYNRNMNKEYTLPTESRNKEYYKSQNRILLDAFSKPKLI